MAWLPSSKRLLLPRSRVVRLACLSAWAFSLCAIISYAYMLRSGVGLGVFNYKATQTSKLPELNVRTSDNIVTTASTTTAPLPCDSECRRFQRLMAQWPRDKPKAAFVYLVYRIEYLLPSIKSVSDFFCQKFDYPIVIFHEAGLFSSSYIQRRVASLTLANAAAWNTSRIFFQQVEFYVPTFLPKPVPSVIPCSNRIGYRHMCRFQAKGVFEQPVIKELEYMWRLDDDSLLLSPVTYDVFRFMRDNNLDYGYVWRHLDAMMCVTGLWEAARKFLRDTNIKPTFFDRWNEPYLFYNNFEVSKLSVWLSADYRRYIDYIDRKGGIYYHRWGDAPIKGIAVSIFIPEKRTHFFTDIGYRHGSFVNGETNAKQVAMYKKNHMIIL